MPKFHEVSVGTIFTIDNNLNEGVLKKIPDERVSCCKVLNSQNIKTNHKIMVKPIEDITVQKND